MGFFTRLLAGLTAAAALGAGLTGTANAVDVTGTTGNTKSVVKLTDDGTNNLPDHIVNGSFDYPSVPSWTGLPGSGSNKYNKGKLYATINPGTGKYGSGCAMSTSGKAIPNWNRSNFAWSSTQGDTHHPGGMSCEAGNVELNYDSVHHNQFGELTADQQGTAIYQDVKVTPGTMMKWSLKHSSTTSAYVDKMQVMIGEPYKETAQEATRIASENGNKVGEKMTTISTPTTSDRADNKKWDTYSGTYLVPDGVTTVRFTFKSIASAEWYSGNDLDDIEFSRSYKLAYDKNSSDAAGEVPSNQRGKENTTQPARTRTSGTVRTVADDAAGRTVLECKQSGEGATGPYADNFCWIDWSNLPLSRTGEPIPVRINVPGGHIDADATITHTNNAALAAKDFIGSKWSRLTSAYKLTGNTALAFSGRMGRQDPAASVTFSNVTPSADRTDTGVNVLKDFRLAFGDAEVMSGGVLQGHDVYEQTDIESDKTLEKLGMIGSGDPNQSYSKANTGYGTTHVTLAGGPKGATDDANKDSKGSAVVGAKQASQFKVSFKQVNQHWDGWGSAIAVGVYMPYLTAYPLTYDKNASDATGEVPSNQRGKENTTQPAKDKTSGTVKTVADTNANLPDHLVNGDFGVNYLDQWRDNYNDWTSIDPNAGKTLHVDNTAMGPNWKWTAINGWDKSKFGWASTQKAGNNIQQKANAVELQYDAHADNMYAELCAYEAGTAIYQDLKTTPGTLYKVRLKHSSISGAYLDKMQVMIGAPGHETPVEMTRTTVNGHGDKLNEKSTVIATKVTNGNERSHADQWETYEGTYLIPDGQTTTRFTFRSVDARSLDRGNLLDDIVFDKAYRLTYDKNASDATGEVPSNQRGRENTTQPAKDKTSGTVRLASDDDVVEYAANGLPKQIMNGDFDHDWRNIVGQSKMSEKYNFANIDPAHGDVEISGALNNKGEASKQWVHLNGFDASQFGWKSNQTDTRVDGRGGIVEIQRSRANDNMYAEITASQADTYLYQDIDTAHDYPTVYTVKLRYAHRNGTINSNEKIQILVGAPGHEQPVEMTRIASDRGNKLGEKSTTVNAPNTDGWLGSWDTFQGSVVVPAGQNVSRFTFKALGSIDGVSGNLIDDVQFKLAYKLSYDKNSQDASGQIPSDETANTVKQAKAKSSGGVRLAADRTDGKVSDLVQRTTTHEDGSVTVRTVDTTTDVVSGCQVYYPAGQKITLATLAKDNDCWDSSMLSRPGHTQLGWNQDRNATAAQPEVTMVEGGMTVYAVWVGNPVLTYDTNKPNTWNGQMPSTPASVSVSYNTAAADGSGWQSGDTSKIRGYRFLGWYAGPQDDAGLYDWNTLLTGNVTVYAHWQRLQANVVYDANGGTGSHANTTGWQYSDVTVPSDTSKSFKRDGYYFKYWNTQKDGKGTTYKDSAQVPLQDKNVTLYAIWAPYHTVITETGGIGLPVLVTGGIVLLVMGIGSTVMLTRRMRGER
ncbi:InlB B-repeat-containing protein [Bifidobacterium catenulatum]|uniref:InlB B-repeat-containing protein n=1 Tax=Bifidobacterium catenulatum subsp. kashiwanohense TaxID=630129 RepID=A0AA43P754_9BIFI|nr:InlB B-repeat-containing protein [Bifidobacterium catenulatum]MDH7890320.1 InlB B-repeat-containing protein [Bifidobacterium catenulatum subsp. kashiwanohense]